MITWGLKKMTAHKTISLFVLLLVLILAAWGCQSKGERAQGPPIKLSLALAPFPYSGLIAIADEKGYFKESGLEVSIKEYSFGFATLEALSRGETQVAMGNELFFVVKINDDPSLRVVASIGLVNTNEIVARRDRNIHEPSGLKGKRIGFSPNTSSEYYLDMFLLAHSILPSEVTGVNIPPTRLSEAIVNGEVDAVSCWDTAVYDTKKGLGENAVSWPGQNNMDWHWVLVVKEDLTRSPEPIKRFLRALVKAETFLLAHEDEARDIIIRKWKFDPEFIRQVWGRTRLNVTLNQSLVTSLENFAKWKMSKEGKAGEIPNFLHYIYSNALEEIDPKAVTIFK